MAPLTRKIVYEVAEKKYAEIFDYKMIRLHELYTSYLDGRRPLRDRDEWLDDEGDWKEIGIDAAKATAEGGVSGLAIYGITNFTNISAGPAAAGVSLAFSVSELAYRKSTGTISDEEFTDGCQIAALNAAVSAVGARIGAVAGQALPLPVIGPILGSVIGSFIATQGLERLCDEGFHNALTMSAYEVRKMTQRLEYGTARIAYSSAYTNQAISQAQTLHEETQTLLDDFNRKKR